MDLLVQRLHFLQYQLVQQKYIIIAASYAKGNTYIKNCACEPEIKKSNRFFKKMGVKISWVNKREIKVVGNQKLKSVKHKIMFDRIEAGTFIIAGAVAGKK